jgi:hypothetical protein
VRYWRKAWATEGGSPLFPPQEIATVKALACELPTQREQPLSRYGTADLARLIAAHPERLPMSASTIWRLLDTAALKPWRHRSWLFPRDPQFAATAGRVLDLYAGRGGGAIGRCNTTSGIGPFGLLVDLVMQRELYRSAPRIFCVVDNGSSHRGTAACQRLQARYPNLVLVHLPTHAAWLHQIEVYFSIVQRKVLTPSDFPDLVAVERRLLAFEARHNATAAPFHWHFTRQDFEAILASLSRPPTPQPLSAATEVSRAA